MQNLCSEKKINDLLHEIREVRNEMSWNKLESWTAAVVASVRKLKTDFRGFRDIVVPFSAGLSEVG